MPKGNRVISVIQNSTLRKVVTILRGNALYKTQSLRLLMNTSLARGEILGLLALANKKCFCLPTVLEALNHDVCCLPLYLFLLSEQRNSSQDKHELLNPYCISTQKANNKPLSLLTFCYFFERRHLAEHVSSLAAYLGMQTVAGSIFHLYSFMASSQAVLNVRCISKGHIHNNMNTELLRKK